MICIILAAGESKRFGENKLLYKIENKTFFQITLEKVLPLFKEIYVVTNYKEVIDMCKKNNVHIILNEDYKKGQGTSIKKTIPYLKDDFMFIVSDMPFLKTNTITDLINLFNSNKNVTRPIAKGKSGNPVIFPQHYSEKFHYLPDNKGGMYVVNSPINYLEVNGLEIFDIDTKEDLEFILSKGLS
ncbi:MAG: NTP transferase domain-containing protein [Lachnospirales bacterium]